MQCSSTIPASIATPVGRCKCCSMHVVTSWLRSRLSHCANQHLWSVAVIFANCLAGGWTHRPMAAWAPCQQSCGSRRRLTSAAKRCRRCMPAPHTPSRSSIRCAAGAPTLRWTVLRIRHRDDWSGIDCTDDVLYSGTACRSLESWLQRSVTSHCPQNARMCSIVGLPARPALAPQHGWSAAQRATS